MFWSWLLFGLGCVRVGVVYNVYFPVKRPGGRNIPSFFAAWLAGELAFHLFAAEALLTLFLLALGAGSHWPGLIGVVLSVVSWVFLLHFYTGGSRALHAIEEKAQEFFSEGTPLPPTDTHPAWTWKQLLLPFSMRHPDVEWISDLRYKESGHARHILDIYRHKERPSRCPVLVQIHGGAWVVGSKEHQGLPLIFRMASQGWVCVSLNYRLCPAATFPDPIEDIHHALTWVREHIDMYGGDPDTIVLTGNSAGGHLASLCALQLTKDPAEAQATPTPNAPKSPSETETKEQAPPGDKAPIDASAWRRAFAGCLPIYGVYDFTPSGRMMKHFVSRNFVERALMKRTYASAPEAFREVSPLYNVHKDAPPFFSLHGDLDALASHEDAQHFYKTLTETSQAPTGLATIPQAQHAFEVFQSYRCLLAIHGLSQVLARLVLRHRALHDLTNTPKTPSLSETSETSETSEASETSNTGALS